MLANPAESAAYFACFVLVACILWWLVKPMPPTVCTGGRSVHGCTLLRGHSGSHESRDIAPVKPTRKRRKAPAPAAKQRTKKTARKSPAKPARKAKR